MSLFPLFTPYGLSLTCTPTYTPTCTHIHTNTHTHTHLSLSLSHTYVLQGASGSEMGKRNVEQLFTALCDTLLTLAKKAQDVGRYQVRSHRLRHTHTHTHILTHKHTHTLNHSHTHDVHSHRLLKVLSSLSIVSTILVPLTLSLTRSTHRCHGNTTCKRQSSTGEGARAIWPWVSSVVSFRN